MSVFIKDCSSFPMQLHGKRTADFYENTVSYKQCNYTFCRPKDCRYIYLQQLVVQQSTVKCVSLNHVSTNIYHLKAPLSQCGVFVLEQKHVFKKHADIFRRQNRFEIRDTATGQWRHQVLFSGIQHGKYTVFCQLQLLTVQIPAKPLSTSTT